MCPANLVSLVEHGEGGFGGGGSVAAPPSSRLFLLLLLLHLGLAGRLGQGRLGLGLLNLLRLGLDVLGGLEKNVIFFRTCFSPPHF